MRSIEFICVGVIALFTLLTIYGFTNLNSETNLAIDQNNVREVLSDKSQSEGNLNILNHQMTKTIFGNWVVKGQVKNTGSGKILYSTITVNFFDKNGNLIYLSSTSLKDIAPGEIKDFEVNYQGSTSPASYNLEYYVN